MSLRRIATIIVFICVICGAAYIFRRSFWPLEKQVSIVAAYDAAKCPGANDIALVIGNHSGVELNRVNARITVQRKGVSEMIASNEFMSEKILMPGSEEIFCIKNPATNDAVVVGKNEGYHDPDANRDTPNDQYEFSAEILKAYESRQ